MFPLATPKFSLLVAREFMAGKGRSAVTCKQAGFFQGLFREQETRVEDFQLNSKKVAFINRIFESRYRKFGKYEVSG